MDYLTFANIIAIIVPFVVVFIDRVHKLSVTQLPFAYTGNEMPMRCIGRVADGNRRSYDV